MIYRIFDKLIECDMKLPELIQTDSGTAELRLEKLKQTLPTKISWLHHWHEGLNEEKGEVTISLAMLDKYVLLRFPDLADFVIDPSFAHIRYLTSPGATVESTRHLLINQIIPRALGQSGRLVLHASGIRMGNAKNLLFVGDSGAGKSTLAANALKHGAELISDDCVLLNNDSRVTCIGNYSGIRLYPDAANATCPDKLSANSLAANKKILVNPLSACLQSQQCAVHGIFLLHPDKDGSIKNDIKTHPLTGVGSFMPLIKQLFMLNPKNNTLAQHQLRQLSAITNSGLPIFKIHYPHDLSMLNELQQKIESISDLL